MELKDVHFLVVDDNELNLAICKEFLEDRGATVSVAHNGKEACDLVLRSSATSFDIVLMDIQMPVVNGIEATKVIRECADKKISKVPIIAFTSEAAKEDIKRAILAGMSGYVNKPINADNFLAEIRKVLNKRGK